MPEPRELHPIQFVKDRAFGVNKDLTTKVTHVREDEPAVIPDTEPVSHADLDPKRTGPVSPLVAPTVPTEDGTQDNGGKETLDPVVPEIKPETPAPTKPSKGGKSTPAPD